MPCCDPSTAERARCGAAPAVRRRTAARLIALGYLAVTFGAAAVRADVYELKDGGAVAGETIARSEEGRYTVRTAGGAVVTLERSQVARIVAQDAAALEYAQRSRKIADTAEAHRELAAWCREHKLAAEAEHHLARVAELDPTDEDAMRSLGYLRVGNRWLSGDELMIERGMKFYDGKYRTPQDIALRERDKQRESANVDWFAKLRLWRSWLDNRREERVAEARALITAIADPAAAPALVRLLEDEEDEEVFELLLGVLGPLEHSAAVQTLVAYTLDPETSGEIRDKCLDHLLQPGRTAPILPYIQALKNRDNVVVNRAAYALGRIGDPAAISPLIDALVTTHKQEAPPANSSGQPISAGFNPNGGGGSFQFGGNAPQIVKVDKQNQRALDALVKLSGHQSFDYDEAAWRAWFVDLQMRQRFNSRRDE